MGRQHAAAAMLVISCKVDFDHRSLGESRWTQSGGSDARSREM
jgi:hypothetical protein